MIAAVVLIPAHVDGDIGVVPFKANPRPLTPLLPGIFNHLFELFQNSGDSVRVDGDVVPYSKSMCDSLFTEVYRALEFQNLVFEISWILGICLPPGSIEGWNLTGLSIFLRQLLDVSSTNFELIVNGLGVQIMVNNSLTCPDNIIFF